MKIHNLSTKSGNNLGIWVWKILRLNFGTYKYTTHTQARAKLHSKIIDCTTRRKLKNKSSQCENLVGN